MKLTNGSEIRNTDDLNRLKKRLEAHYNHFLEIFNDASRDVTNEEIQSYYVAINYTITLCYDNGEEEEDEKELD